MGEERRRSKRLPLEVDLKLEELEIDEVVTVKYLNVEVTDLSRSGIGFKCRHDLEVGKYFDTKLQIWTKEVIDCVIEIVRKSEGEDGYKHYGCIFVGMNETDVLKIDIYQMFNE